MLQEGTATDRSESAVREARLAVRAARYDDALALLDGCAHWDAPHACAGILLVAEVHVHRTPVAAVAFLSTFDELFAGDEDRFAYEVALGRAYVVVRDLASAELHYAAADAFAPHVPNGPALLGYHRARLRWLRHENDPDDAGLALALTHPDPAVAASAYAQRGWIHASRGDYTAQIADLRRALAYASRGDGALPPDLAALAITAHSLARVAFETADDAGMDAARAAYDAIAWTDDVAVHRYATLRILGWDAFMRGRAGHAQWAFRDAATVAPSVAWRVMAHLDRAYVARLAGNEVWAIEELAQADLLAHEVAWESTYGEERQALVVLATLFAPVDAARAQRYAATYTRIGTENVNPMLAIAADKRAVGFARYAQGRIDQTLGRRVAAVAALCEAYEIFDAAAHHYRASLAASALAELTGEAAWRDAAVAHAQHYPDCPLGALVDVAVARESAIPPALTALQRQIAKALWSGASEQELSRRFSRSLYTIGQQIDAICAAFGARSRRELLDEAARRGLL